MPLSLLDPYEWCLTQPEYSIPPDWIDHVTAVCNAIVYSPDGFIVPFDEEIEAEGPRALQNATGIKILSVS